MCCRELISPVMRGLENLPSASDTQRPLLFVGNHARIGLYDMPYLIMELYLRRIKVLLLFLPLHTSVRTPLIMSTTPVASSVQALERHAMIRLTAIAVSMHSTNYKRVCSPHFASFSRASKSKPLMQRRLSRPAYRSPFV